MRARGLKHGLREDGIDMAVVAPHAGAWVETVVNVLQDLPHLGRAPCGRVG